LRAESEFRAKEQGIFELLWLKIMLQDLKNNWDEHEPVKVYYDNKSAINIAYNSVQHD